MQDSLLQWFAQRFLDRRLLPRELLNTRKMIYIGLVLVLFFTSFLWRRYSIETQATQLAILEQNRGDVELSGSIVRLTLTGSRGLATCWLWINAMEKQKRNQWNELEFYVNALTKLQPHFITPWLFQSWNLAYNVSVESDRPFDKYFYIARGVQLLAEGERKNRDIPELRFYNGFYMQHKICVSDETNVLRSLFQLSMIPPNERDPARFRKRNEAGEVEIILQEFEAFCTKNPKLVRRLATGLRRDDENQQIRQFTCKNITEVVDFLTDSWRVPSVYQETSKTPTQGDWVVKSDNLATLAQRFPTLPPVRQAEDIKPQKLFTPADGFAELTDQSTLDDTTDAHAIARAWFGYAQEPVPPPGDLPGSNRLPEDPRKQRRPKQMSTLIWRSYPALAQTHLCQNLQQEGWFDSNEAWEIPNWFEPSNRFSNGKVAAVAMPPAATSREQWDLAARIWKKHGEANHLIFKDTAEEINTNQLAQRYWDARGMNRNSDPLQLSEGALNAEQRERLLPEQKREILVKMALEKLTLEQQAQFKAAEVLYELNLYRSISNFLHHYYMSSVEAEPETVTARKLFARATMFRYQAQPSKALLTYLDPDALFAWRDRVLSWPVIDRHPQYRNDQFIQEESFETQLDYLLLVENYERDIKRRLVRELALMSFLGQSACLPGGSFLGQSVCVPGGMFSPIPLSLGLTAANYETPPDYEFYPRPLNVTVIDTDRLAEFLTMFVPLNLASEGTTGQMAMAMHTAGLSRPLIPENIANMVRDRRKVNKPQTAAQAPAAENKPVPLPAP